jgi:hypothetical protein
MRRWNPDPDLWRSLQSCPGRPSYREADASIREAKRLLSDGQSEAAEKAIARAIEGALPAAAHQAFLCWKKSGRKHDPDELLGVAVYEAVKACRTYVRSGDSRFFLPYLCASVARGLSDACIEFSSFVRIPVTSFLSGFRSPSVACLGPSAPFVIADREPDGPNFDVRFREEVKRELRFKAKLTKKECDAFATLSGVEDGYARRMPVAADILGVRLESLVSSGRRARIKIQKFLETSHEQSRL